MNNSVIKSLSLTDASVLQIPKGLALLLITCAVTVTAPCSMFNLNWPLASEELRRRHCSSGDHADALFFQVAFSESLV